LFREIASGEFLANLYQASLSAIATNPAALGSATGMRRICSETGRRPGGGAFPDQTLQRFHPGHAPVIGGAQSEGPGFRAELLAGRNEFAARVIGAMLEAAATALEDGLSANDFIELATAAVRASANNLALVAMDRRWRAVLVA
jgi:hypothetical protein